MTESFFHFHLHLYPREEEISDILNSYTDHGELNVKPVNRAIPSHAQKKLGIIQMTIAVKMLSNDTMD